MKYDLLIEPTYKKINIPLLENYFFTIFYQYRFPSNFFIRSFNSNNFQRFLSRDHTYTFSTLVTGFDFWLTKKEFKAVTIFSRVI